MDEKIIDLIPVTMGSIALIVVAICSFFYIENSFRFVFLFFIIFYPILFLMFFVANTGGDKI